MERKILFISKNKTNLYESIIYWLEQEKIEYEFCKEMPNKISEDVGYIIYIDYETDNQLTLSKINIPAIIISNAPKIINEDIVVNYIITSLTNDETDYTSVQKEYLYKKGIYSIITDKISELINDETDLNGLIIDVTNCKTKLKDWVFSFDSIGETYAWLSKKNNNNSDFTEKIVNFYHEKIYNDSSKEINYLADKIKNIQNNQKSIDLFICTKSELDILKDNYFFKLLLKNIASNHSLYIIDRNILITKEPEIYNKLLDGVAIYEDCVYIDTYDDEYSLGKVDCKKSTIDEYNKYFDYIIDKYGTRLYTEDDVNGI